MRVLFVTPTLALGGSERLTVRYAAGLKRRGHDVAIAYAKKNLQQDAIERDTLTVVKVAKRVPMRESVADWVINLRALVEEFAPDVIHAQAVAVATVARAAAPRCPLVVTMHGVPTGDEALAALALRAIRARVTAVSAATADGLGRFPWSPRVELLLAGIDVAQVTAESTSVFS